VATAASMSSHHGRRDGRAPLAAAGVLALGCALARRLGRRMRAPAPRAARR